VRAGIGFSPPFAVSPFVGLVSLACNLFDGMQERRNAGTGGGAAARGEDLFVVAGFGNFRREIMWISRFICRLSSCLLFWLWGEKLGWLGGHGALFRRIVWFGAFSSF
jgi:hypothetical protein